MIIVYIGDMSMWMFGYRRKTIFEWKKRKENYIGTYSLTQKTGATKNQNYLKIEIFFILYHSEMRNFFLRENKKATIALIDELANDFWLYISFFFSTLKTFVPRKYHWSIPFFWCRYVCASMYYLIWMLNMCACVMIINSRNVCIQKSMIHSKIDFTIHFVRPSQKLMAFVSFPSSSVVIWNYESYWEYPYPLR